MAKEKVPVDKAKTATSFLAGVLALLPEEARAGAQVTFDLIGTTELARNHVAERTLAQADYSRGQDELRTSRAADAAALVTERQSLVEATTSMNTERDASWNWHEKHKTAFADPGVKAALAALEAGKPVVPGAVSPKPGEVTPPAVDTSKFITLEDHKKAQETFATEALSVMNQLQELSSVHRDDFGTRLTAAEMHTLETHAEVSRLGLAGVHQLVYAEQYTAKATAAQEKHDEEILEKGRLAGVAEASKAAGPGYPIPGAQPQVLDALDLTAEQQVEAAKESEPAAMAAAYSAKVVDAPPEAFI